MKKALIVMVALLVVMGGAALRAGTFTVGVRSGMEQFVKLLPVLVIAMLLAGFTEVLLPKHTVEAWLSDASGLRGIAVAWVAGALTPGGSLVGLPLVASLVKVGAGPGVLVTYMTSMTLLSFLRVPLEMAIVGPRMLALRLAANVLLPPVAGIATQAMAAMLRR